MLTQPLSTEYGEAFANYNGQVEYRYAPGKWSIKEVLGHIADTERVMAYRLLRFAQAPRTT